ncbi:MAG: Panacea domain-containing protein [Pirellulaceae bacterium]
MSGNEKKKKLIETTAAILRSAPSNELNIVVLNKALFYVDLVALRDHGNTLTENSYIALENGPVVAKYPQRLIKPLAEARIAEQVDRWNGAKPLVLIKSQEPPDFLVPHLDTINRVTGYFATMTSEAASKYSHLNPGWRMAWRSSSETGQPCPINMLIALQQIVEDDLWTSEPLVTQERQSIIRAADDGEGESW